MVVALPESTASCPWRRRRQTTTGLVILVALVVAAVVAFPVSTRADEASPARGASPSTGRRVTYAERPSFESDLRACSARVPVCVQASSPEDGSAAIVTLGAFERAWQTLTGALGVPAPDVDPATLAYDVFLTTPTDELVTTELEARDVRSRVDRGRAFSRVDRRVKAGCVLDGLAAAAVARASLFRVAPATEEGTARAQTKYLAQLAVPCALGYAADEAATFQSRPNRTFVDAYVGTDSASVDTTPEPTRASILFASGASEFWERIDWAFGRTPGGIVTATWALHPTMTPVPAERWNNQPDSFDVLRKSFKGAMSTGGTVSDLWVDFGVARAFFGSADDGQHLPELRTFGDAARVPVDWDIGWPKEPRRLTGRGPIHPTGAAYLVVHHDGARADARLRIEAEWEQRSLFRWALVKLDASGRELGRVVVPSTERATQAQMTLVDLEGVDRILIVGVNIGDPAYGFDPDDEVWEPHGFVVTLAEE